jgi:hypothetical protein
MSKLSEALTILETLAKIEKYASDNLLHHSRLLLIEHNGLAKEIDSSTTSFEKELVMSIHIEKLKKLNKDFADFRVTMRNDLDEAYRLFNSALEGLVEVNIPTP